MKRVFAALLSPVVLLGLQGCGQNRQAQTPADPQEVSQPAQSGVSEKKSVDPAAAAVLKGSVLYEGQVPAPVSMSIAGNPECAVLHPGGQVTSEEIAVNDGRLQNVFIYIKEGLEGYQFQAPQAPATMENTKCLYVPHVLGVQVDQPVVLLNNDPTLHNVHSYSKNSKPWNLGLPFQGMKQTKKFSSPEVMVTLKCDVHPWMIGYIGVLGHPYFAVTDVGGNFEIKNLPPGEYELGAWHEKLGAQSQKVRIEPQETKVVEFKYSA